MLAFMPAGMLVAIPVIVGFITSVVLAEPFLEVARHYNHEAFALSDREKVEGAKMVRHHELRLQMDSAIGRMPRLSEAEMQVRMCLEQSRLEYHKLCQLSRSVQQGLRVVAQFSIQQDAGRLLFVFQ